MEEVQALNHLGLVYYYWGAYPKAVEAFEGALELAEAAGVEQPISQILNNLGLVHYAWGRYQEALEDYEQARRRNLASGQQFYAATNLANMAGVYLAWGKYDQALEYYQQALQLAENIGAQNQLLTNLRSIASIHQGRKDYELAIDCYRRSLELARQLGRRSDVAVNLDGLGTVYFEWRKLDQALNYYRQALAEAQAIGKQDEISRILIHTAGVYQVQGDTDRALETFLTALGMTRQTIHSGQDTRDAYATLGLSSWQDLPGTLTEVREIGAIVAGSTVVTGGEVSESRIKEMSARGALQNYRVVHFATHGLVVPPLPELSALVLSQSSSPHGDREDGYLTMGEIAGLEIRADFVNLSACETGLGKIYGGEGVVGLSQAFLVAGANGLSVSLWQVADESTRTFMVGLYRLTETEGLSHQQAMTEMKRRFIADPSLKEPFYWAPFMYYGR